MKVKLYEPQNTLLQKYIKCFYILQRRPDDKGITYISFPSIFTMACLNADSKIEMLENNLTITHCPDNKLEMTLTRNFEYSGWIRYKGAADEIVIYFKPLGINAFLEKDLKHYIQSFFVKFNPFVDYQKAMLDFFLIDDQEARIQSLENYWLSKHRGFEHPFLQNVVDEIMNEDEPSSLAEVAQKNGISRMTLNKHFDLHIGTTPSQFRKIVRFRNAMKQYRQKISAENLTDISSAVDYFDQSHMIKDFKALTKHPPKAFFSKLSTIEDGQINWLFL